MGPDATTSPTTSTPPVPCGVDDPRIRTFGLLLEANARLTRLLDADLRASDGLTLQTFEVLLRVARSDGGQVTMSELAAATSLTTGGVTRLADRLTRDGLVERVACPGDRRVVHVRLTAAGHQMLERALDHHLGHLEAHVASRIDPGDLDTFERVLDTLRHDPD